MTPQQQSNQDLFIAALSSLYATRQAIMDFAKTRPEGSQLDKPMSIIDRNIQSIRKQIDNILKL